ncbi:MAG: hypothetical protein R3B93_16105 [Bacteroidia bacterium]
MKRFKIIIALLIIWLPFSCKEGKSISLKEKDPHFCLANPDPEYDILKVLTFADTLNVSVPEFRKISKNGFSVTAEGSTLGFLVTDLSNLRISKVNIITALNFMRGIFIISSLG